MSFVGKACIKRENYASGPVFWWWLPLRWKMVNIIIIPLRWAGILMMASTQVVETSVTTTDNSPSQDYNHPDDQTTLLQKFVLCWLLLNLVTLTCSLLMCAFCRVYHLTGSPTSPIIENQEQEISYPNLSISWSSGDTSGCPVTMYTVYYKSIKLREEGNTWNRINASSSTRELSALPLDCDTEYELRVSAWNEMGESNRSESWKVKSITGIHINFFFSFYFCRDDLKTIVISYKNHWAQPEHIQCKKG